MSIDFDTIKAQTPLTDVVGRYVDLRKRGKNWWGLCPFHEDTRPTNFNVYNCKDGIQRYRCFACDEHGDVIDFVSAMESCSNVDAVKILNGGQLPDVGTYVPKPKPPKQEEDWTVIVPAPDGVPEYDPGKTFNPTKGGMSDYTRGMERLDAYRGEGDKLLFYVIRLQYPDSPKMTIAISWCKGPQGRQCWAAKRMEEPFPIMGLNELMARPDAKVIIVSGEKCKASLSEEFPEYVVISWLGGDGAVARTDWSPLMTVASVLLWPDADAPGNTGMNKLKKIVDSLIEKNGTG